MKESSGHRLSVLEYGNVSLISKSRQQCKNVLINRRLNDMITSMDSHLSNVGANKIDQVATGVEYKVPLVSILNWDIYTI